MRETKKMADQAKRVAEEVHNQAAKFGQEDYQNTAQASFDAARSFSDANKGFQMIAAEMTEYSKKTLDDVFRAWEQLVRARSYTDVLDIQCVTCKQRIAISPARSLRPRILRGRPGDVSDSPLNVRFRPKTGHRDAPC